MTISPQFFTSTDSLIRPGKTKLYPVFIPVPHPQLRHFISAVDQDWIYLASNCDVYALHLPSQRKSLLVTLPFSPRCLVAGLGWICVGGEKNGDSAFIRLNKSESDSRPHDGGKITGKPLSNAGHYDSLRSHPEIVLHKLGEDIVNSITLHELSDARGSGCNEPVALLSNNDNTVKIYSLLQEQLVSDLKHPFPMNYALISPDSEILAAVGDSGQAYFYARKLVLSTKSSQGRFPRYEWKVLAKPKLARGDRTNDDHSFSITFSPSGHLCAVSAQGGMISVFDMAIINCLSNDGAESFGSAIICSFNSSRSGICGCIRSMAFSPAPWDLLAWVEDHGRAGIADVRQAFCRRQIIKLETHAPDLERITLQDLPDPNIKRLDLRDGSHHQDRETLRLQDPFSAAESLLAASEDWPDSSMLQRQDPVRIGAASLDDREQSVLESLEVTMEGVHDAMNLVRRLQRVDEQTAAELRRSVESGQRGHSRAHLEILIDAFRERNLRLDDLHDRFHPPQRRNSVVLSQGAGSTTDRMPRLVQNSSYRSRITASPARMTEADIEIDGSRLPTSLSANDLAQSSTGHDPQQQSYNNPSSDLWRVTPSALSSHVGTNPLSGSSGPRAQVSQQDSSDMVDEVAVGHAIPSASLSTLRPSTQTSNILTTLNSAYAQAMSRVQSHPNTLRRAVPTPELDAEPQVRHWTSSTPDDESQRRIIAEAPSELRESRLGRPMIMHNAGNMMDANGNWVASEARERLLGRPSHGDANGLGGNADARERGVGTAGVGWSDDGRQLYVGTEKGIFEYAINLTDRKTFPSLDLR